MQISGEGKIGIGLSLAGIAGGGIQMVAPQYTWIGWVLIAFAGAGVVALAYCHFFGQRRSYDADTPIHLAIDYIVNDSRAKLRSVPVGCDTHIVSRLSWQGEEHQDALQRIREKALLGNLRIWGRIQVGQLSALVFDDALREIPLEYWQNSTFDSLFCFHKTEHPQTTPLGGAHGTPLYTHITLSSTQLHSFWPKKSLWHRLRQWMMQKPRLSYRAILRP